MFVKLLFKASLPLLSVFGATAYVMYLNGHNPLELVGVTNIYDKSSTFIQGVENAVDEGVSISPPSSSSETIYKWQDDAGQWHYSATISDMNASVQTLKINPNVNVIASEPVKKVVHTASYSNKGKAPAQNATGTPISGMTSPGAIKQVFEDAKNVQSLLESRQKAQLEAMSRR